MTVLIPSLPPSSWSTTSTRPSRSGPAASAVRERKPGTSGESESIAEFLSRVRRVGTMSAPLLFCRRELRLPIRRLTRSGDGAPSYRLHSYHLRFGPRQKQCDRAIQSLNLRHGSAGGRLPDLVGGDLIGLPACQQLTEGRQRFRRLL